MSSKVVSLREAETFWDRWSVFRSIARHGSSQQPQIENPVFGE
jgi:hypothetical protein